MSNDKLKFFAETVSSVPMARDVSILSAQTNSTGTSYTAYGDNPCDALDIVNNSGTAIEYRRDGAGSTIPIPDGSSRLVVGISNANEVEIKRVDDSNTQVTVTAEAIKV